MSASRESRVASRGDAVRLATRDTRLALLLILTLLALATLGARKISFDPKLPALGTQFGALPAGEGKSIVEERCLPCHSADIVLQQHLTEKQWTATVEKMMRWGSDVKENEKAPVIAYLVKHFGPENRYVPRKTRPVGY